RRGNRAADPPEPDQLPVPGLTSTASFAPSSTRTRPSSGGRVRRFRHGSDRGQVAGNVDISKRVSIRVERSPLALLEDPRGEPIEQAPQAPLTVRDQASHPVGRGAGPDGGGQRNEGAA